MIAVQIAAVILLILVSASVFFALKHQRRSQNMQRQNLGLARMQSLRALLSRIQKHRGLSNGYLNGDRSLLGQIEPLQRASIHDIHDITAVSPDIREDPRWQNITQHWARLSGNFKKNTAVNNLTQHNKLVQSILYLIEDTADKFELTSIRNSSGKSLRFTWKELLVAAECIGQARAIGTGIAAAGVCDSVSRIRLSYLQQKIEETTGLAWTGLPAGKNQRQLLDSLLICINNDILSPTPSICANDYFQLCTEAMDSLYDQYDQTIHQLKAP